MKRFLFFMLAAAISTVGYAKEIRGKVIHSKKGVSQVVVSDGFSFTVTDAQGNYTLNASDE
ncbi:MAG: serine/threonine protein phosphatase, partial [Bacteroidales bacterium]|nr:serine/threonine protein phosphatase [Bacteroidales bacterium]